MGFFSKIASVIKGSSSQVATVTVRIMPATNDAEHNHYFLTGSEIIKPYMQLSGASAKPAKSEAAKADILRGIGLLYAVVEYNKDNWAAWWTIGKGYQALQDADKACDAFAKSYAIHRENADVAREYMVECLNLGRKEEAISAAEYAVGLSPNNAGLIANLALAYMIAGRLADAQSVINKSLGIAPNDKISLKLKRVIQEIVDGKRSQPRTLRDVS